MKDQQVLYRMASPQGHPLLKKCTLWGGSQAGPSTSSVLGGYGHAVDPPILSSPVLAGWPGQAMWGHFPLIQGPDDTG